MREIKPETIITAVKSAIKEACTAIEPAMLSRLIAVKDTACGLEKFALDQIIANSGIADGKYPVCQDTGIAVFFADIGIGVKLCEPLGRTLNEAVRQAYNESYFRLSVAEPLTRENTGDNTPAVLHINITDGDNLKISFMPKGAGSENMSRHYMINPGDGGDGIADCVIDCVRKAGANPCPPIVIGVGAGSDFEGSCLLAKRALLRATGEPGKDPAVRALELRILEAVNSLDIGVMGMGGALTAAAVHIETAPTHIGMLPVAVNIQCHCVRHGTVLI